MMWSGGRAQMTKQNLGSAKLGSISGFSSLSKMGSIINSLNSAERNLSLCCAFLATRWAEYSARISACKTSVSRLLERPSG